MVPTGACVLRQIHHRLRLPDGSRLGGNVRRNPHDAPLACLGTAKSPIDRPTGFAIRKVPVREFLVTTRDGASNPRCPLR